MCSLVEHCFSLSECVCVWGCISSPGLFNLITSVRVGIRSRRKLRLQPGIKVWGRWWKSLQGLIWLIHTARIQDFPYPPPPLCERHVHTPISAAFAFAFIPTSGFCRDLFLGNWGQHLRVPGCGQGRSRSSTATRDSWRAGNTYCCHSNRCATKTMPAPAMLLNPP